MKAERGEVVALCGDPAVTRRLAVLVAEAASAHWGDQVGVLHLVARDAMRPSCVIEGVLHAWAEVGRPDALRHTCAPWTSRVARLFVATSPEAARRADRVVCFGDGPAPPTHLPTLRVSLLAPDATPTAPWPDLGVDELLARGLVAGCVPHLRAGSRRVAPFPTVATARVRLDPAWTAGDSSFARLPLAARESVGRLARAITGRRVGVALGGAGAWGYTSVALMLAMQERGVPVDLVAGSSSGALAGAYQCARGADGLARLIARGPSLRRAIGLMALSSRPAEWAVDADLGGARIESLEAIFLPVTTNLTRLRAEVVVEGTLGFGVRASVSAPGLFAPARADDGSRLVDGAVTDNAPASLVEAAGADLAVVANALPAPLPDARSRLPIVGRALDFADAFGTLLHRAGESTPGPRRVVFSASPARDPLRRTFRYDEAAFIAEAARRDPRFVEAVEAVASAWSALQRPRVLPSEPFNAVEFSP